MIAPAVSSDPVKLKRRRLAPRFSLKMLMLAVTLAAVGAAFWWRWPVTQTTEKKDGSRVTTETFTYHRGLRGNLIKHGVHRIERDDDVELEEHFQEGLLHGPYRQINRGRSVVGAYYQGKPHGTWKYEVRSDELTEEVLRQEEHWNRGQREGLFQRWDQTGKLCFSFEFKNDKLIAAQNSPSGSLLARRVADGQFSNQPLQAALFSNADFDYWEVPLVETLEDIIERFHLPLAVRWKRKTVALKAPPQPPEEPQPAMHEIPFSDEWVLVEPDNPHAPPHLTDMRPRSLARPASPAPPPPVVMSIYNVPVTVAERSVPRLVGLDAFLSPLGLILDYRFGALCIVDADGAGEWKDNTGVMDLRPSPETSLADRLDAPPKPTCFEPLREVLRNLAADQEIDVEFRLPENQSLDDLFPGTERVGLFREVLTIRNSPESNPKEPLPITLRQLLGLILDQAHLHCREEKGVLIIEPPPGAVTTPVKKIIP